MAELPIGYPQAQAPRSAGMATASLVFGIISIPATCVCVGPVLGIAAIVLGAVGISRARRQPERYTGDGRAVGGIVTGAVSLLLTVALALFGGAIAKSLSGIVHTGADTVQLEEALKAYGQAHHDYPPDLATLASEGMVPPNPLSKGSAADPFPGFRYVRDVHPSDPPRWILAYKRISLGPIPMVWVFYADGSNELLDAGRFAAEMTTFKKAYEEARGAPPEISPPEEEP